MNAQPLTPLLCCCMHFYTTHHLIPLSLSVMSMAQFNTQISTLEDIHGTLKEFPLSYQIQFLRQFLYTITFLFTYAF